MGSVCSLYIDVNSGIIAVCSNCILILLQSLFLHFVSIGSYEFC